MNYSFNYWERCWQREDVDELNGYLKKYNNAENEIIDIFKRDKINSICDATCGFGAYSLLFASNGFNVEGLLI